MENMVESKAFWRGKKVFITGHTGFKGSWLSLWLYKLGAIVKGYSQAPHTNPSLFELCQLDKLVDSTIGDIRDLQNLQLSMNAFQPDIVIHMAAQPLVRDSYDIPVDTYSINVMGTVNLLESVRNCKSVKVVLNVTTDKCYENKEWVWGYREHDQLGGHDPYSNSKACSELVTSAYRNSYFNKLTYKDHGVAIATARAGNVIGGGDWAKDRLIPDILQALLSERPITIRNPQATRPWQHVLEPLSGYLLLCQRLYVDGIEYAQAWNFGPKEEDVVSVKQVLQKIISRWDHDVEITMDTSANPHEANLLKLDCSKAIQHLAWKPRWNLDQTTDKIVEWTRAYRDGLSIKSITLMQIEEYENS